MKVSHVLHSASGFKRKTILLFMTKNISKQGSHKNKFNMGKRDRNVRKTQWHPPFCASMHLEFSENKDELEYYMEYPLNTKPVMIDLLVVKKKAEVNIKKMQ